MKQKSHSGIKKRIKKTATGKFVYNKPAKRHLLVNKSKRQKRSSISGQAASKPITKVLKKMVLS
jgi:large subunit ribosomal protein L35